MSSPDPARTTIASEMVADFARLMRPAEVDENRALLVAELAMERVGAIVSPIPAAARPILLDVIRRAYTNPDGVQQETVGPFTRTLRASGVYLLDNERADLEAMAAATNPAARGAWTIRPGGHRPVPPPDAPRWPW